MFKAIQGRGGFRDIKCHVQADESSLTFSSRFSNRAWND